MEFLAASELLAIEGDGQGRVKSVKIRTPDGEIEIAADFVFLALGQAPNSETARQVLNVNANGFIAVDSRMRTSVPDVYAVGDVTGFPMEMFKARSRQSVAGDVRWPAGWMGKIL
jgi:dihydrolipoamide dehydrogenase